MIKYNNKTIEITDVKPVEQFGEVQYYTALISIKELYSVKNRLTYDSEAQRGEVDGKPVIDQKHVNQIYNSFMDGNSIRGHLTWNLRDDENSLFEYNEDANSLIVSSDQLITIPDSAHRHEALYMIAEKNDEDYLLDSKFSLDIYNLTKTEEKELFYTINGKTKHPNKNRTLYLSNDIECKLLRDVISKSNLKGKIECVGVYASKDGKLTKFSTLYESLFNSGAGESTFKVTKDNYDELSKYLIEFYDALLKSRKEFQLLSKEDKEKSKENSMVLEELAWWGYAYLAKKLKDDSKWKSKLHQKMNKKISVEGGSSVHFLEKSLPIWHATVIKPKYNFITKTQEIGSSVTNSSSTRESIKQIFALQLM